MSKIICRSSPSSARTASLTSFRKVAKAAEQEVRSLSHRIAFINRHFQQIEKEKSKLVINNSRKLPEMR